MAAVCTFSARLDYVTLDLTNMSAPSRCQVGVADCKMSSAKEGLVLSVRLKAFNASCWLLLDQLTGKRGGIGSHITSPSKVMKFFAVWKANNPGRRPRTPQENPRKFITNPRTINVRLLDLNPSCGRCGLLSILLTIRLLPEI
jgi:hypothetical protein